VLEAGRLGGEGAEETVQIAAVVFLMPRRFYDSLVEPKRAVLTGSSLLEVVEVCSQLGVLSFTQFWSLMRVNYHKGRTVSVRPAGFLVRPSWPVSIVPGNGESNESFGSRTRLDLGTSVGATWQVPCRSFLHARTTVFRHLALLRIHSVTNNVQTV
jgi:hypothetical protein